MTSITVTTFYKFVALDANRIEELKSELTERADNFAVTGLIIMGQEGVNATVSGTQQAINSYKQYLLGVPEFSGLLFKNSPAEKLPFKRFKVKVRPEIVTLANTNLVPKGENHHLPPAEWKKVIETEKDIAIIDTRNWYEVELGKFEGAIDPRLEMFNEFPDFVAKLNMPKDKKVLMYCTGGIRCEKAILEMQRQGYENVYQLEGGILKYLEEFPDDKFQGECFVFDHRVAVKQDLKPSDEWRLCPLCGNPGNYRLDDCAVCHKEAVICTCCNEKGLVVCSKNCKHHFNLRSARGEIQN